MYKVFLRDKVICFVLPAEMRNAGDECYTLSDIASVQQILTAIDRNQNRNEFWFIDENPEQLFISFYTRMKIVAAAGGVVLNRDGQMLFIYRRGHWDLPKGKIDFGETEEQAALREVTEETGIATLKIRKRLSSTFHVYTIGHEWILKETHWFLMNSPEQARLIPQTEEGISDIRWIDPAGVEEMQEKVFLSLRSVVSDALNSLAD